MHGGKEWIHYCRLWDIILLPLLATENMASPKRTPYTDKKGQAYQATLTVLACTENSLSRTTIDGSVPR